MRAVSAWLRIGAGIAIVMAVFYLSAGLSNLSKRHGFCWKCHKEYQRGWEEGVMALQLALERHGYAVFVNGEWHPIRGVTLEQIMKEQADGKATR